MKATAWRTVWRWLIGVALWLPLSGCYYVQAVRGHWSVVGAAEPVDQVIADSGTDSQLRARLRMSQEALDFAHRELGLPDNGSYREFVALERDYVVMNVFAAPPFSLTPKTWCYPFVGCLAYRGYFAASDAERYADKLRRRGLDVHVGRSAAYSTLGRFNDPLLSTMFARSDDSLVWLLFHELAHQVIYVDGDTTFNESFASAVADAGLARWRAAQGRSIDADVTVRLRERRQAMRDELERLRTALASLYDSETATEEAKVNQKRQLFDGISATWRAQQWPGKPPANNAALVVGAIYDALVPEFTAILATECEQSLPCLYERVRELGAMSKAERDALLQSAATP